MRASTIKLLRKPLILLRESWGNLRVRVHFRRTLNALVALQSSPSAHQLS